MAPVADSRSVVVSEAVSWFVAVAAHRAEWAKGLGAEKPAALSALLAKVDAWRASLELQLAALPQ